MESRKLTLIYYQHLLSINNCPQQLQQCISSCNEYLNQWKVLLNLDHWVPNPGLLIQQVLHGSQSFIFLTKFPGGGEVLFLELCFDNHCFLEKKGHPKPHVVFNYHFCLVFFKIETTSQLFLDLHDLDILEEYSPVILQTISQYGFPHVSS